MLNRNLQRSLIYTRLGLSKPLRVNKISPSSQLFRHLQTQAQPPQPSPPQDVGDFNAEGGHPEFGFKQTFWKMFEAAATAAASIAILGYAPENPPT